MVLCAVWVNNITWEVFLGDVSLTTYSTDVHSGFFTLFSVLKTFKEKINILINILFGNIASSTLSHEAAISFFPIY